MDTSVTCPNCGAINPIDSQYCDQCSMPLHGGPRPDQTLVGRARPVGLDGQAAPGVTPGAIPATDNLPPPEAPAISAPAEAPAISAPPAPVLNGGTAGPGAASSPVPAISAPPVPPAGGISPGISVSPGPVLNTPLAAAGTAPAYPAAAPRRNAGALWNLLVIGTLLALVLFILVTVFLIITLPSTPTGQANGNAPTARPATEIPTSPQAAPTATSIAWVVPSPVPQVQAAGTDPQEQQLIAAVNANPKDVAARRALASYYADKRATTPALLANAIAQYEAILWLDSTDIAAAQILSDLYVADQQPETALAILQWSAQHVAPNYKASAYNKLGRFYADHGRFQEAIDAFRQAVNADPHFIESWRRLGDIYKSQPDNAAARQAYQNCINYAASDSNQDILNTCKQSLSKLPAP